jgi:hypothetical protein
MKIYVGYFYLRSGLQSSSSFKMEKKLTGKDLGIFMANLATKVIFVKTVSNVFMAVNIIPVIMVSMLVNRLLIFWFPCSLSVKRLQTLLL